MLRLQDIAEQAGVSRTTVSNVIHGHTKRVSQETIDRINGILKSKGYVPNMGAALLSGKNSKIIGMVLGYNQIHGMYAVQDPFVGQFLSVLEKEADAHGYYLMLIAGDDYKNVVDIASRWSIEGLIILGYSEDKYYELHRKLNKKMILIDTYVKGEYTFPNIGIDDYSGGYQTGAYLLRNGYEQAMFLAETNDASDYYRWLGFKRAMEYHGRFCGKSRFQLLPREKNSRLIWYRNAMDRLLSAKALAFSSDYTAIEAMNFFSDSGIDVPEQISVAGFDDSIYAEFVRPRLTTVHQDVNQKAKQAFHSLLKMINGEPLSEMCVKNKVWLVKRDSVKEKK